MATSALLTSQLEQQIRELQQQLATNHNDTLLQVLESIGDAFFLLDKDWKFVMVNKNHEQVSQTVRQDILGKSFWEIFPATAVPTSKYWTEYHQVVKSKQPAHFTAYYEPLEMWTEVNAYPTADGGISVFFRDISKRKRAEQALAESEARWRFMAESMPHKIFTATPDGKVDYFNQQWEAYTGISLKNLHRDGVRHLVHPDDLPESMRQWRLALKTGHIMQNQQRLRRADGSYRYHLSYSRPMYGEDGQVLRWFGSMTDIEDILQATARNSELEKVTAALEQQRTQLILLNKSKDEFIALASHQLRTPATGVKQYVGMLLEGYAGDTSEEQRRFLQSAYDSNERQLTIVNDLLKVASVDAGKVKLHLAEIQLVPLIEEVIAEQASRFAEKHQTVTFKHGTSDFQVLADRDLLRMVFENIIDNASKYTYEAKSITIALTQSAKTIAIAVTDQGVGIAAADIEKLGQKFTRFDNPLSIRVGGTGIGLYWVKKVLDLHGGNLHVVSKEGSGSKFTIRLQRAQQSSRPA